MTVAVIRVREARATDLDAVVAVFLSCWRVSYTGILPDEVIGIYDEDSARELWRGSMEQPAAGTVGLVAEQPGQGVVAITRIGGDPDEPTAGHVYSLYVHPAAQGQGAGARLLAAADDWFRAHARTEATLWVFAANAPARRFYVRLGWQPDGGERVQAVYGQPEVRLRRPVSGPSPRWRPS